MSAPYRFDRYRNGRLMAEGIKVNKENCLEDAIKVAARLADHGDVLVYDVAIDAALAEIGAVRVKPLVWSEWDENSNYPSCDALGAFSLWYFIDTSEARHGEPDLPLFKKTCHHTPRKRLSEHHSVEDAKAAAQADYEARILAALEPVTVTVQEAARVLYEMPKEDRMKVWRATRGCPIDAEFGKWFCKGLRALANDEEAAAMQEMADDDKAHAAMERMWEDG